MSQRLIGLTGGIATGKTTVAQYLAAVYSFPILDADLFARDAVQPGSTVLARISDRYGPSVLEDDDSLNRRALGDIVFAHPEERRWLEAQIHPYVRDRIKIELKQLQVPVVVLVIPLLFEAGMGDLVTEIWVVTCDLATQIQRLRQRDSLTLEQIQARIRAQMPLEQKIAQATVVLDNTATPEALLKQVDAAVFRLPGSKPPT